MNEILLKETQEVSAAREVPQFLDYDYDNKDLYQVEMIIIEDIKENFNDVSVHLNAKRRINMGLKIKNI